MVVHCPGGADIEVPGGVGDVVAGDGVGVAVGHAAAVDVQADVLFGRGEPFEAETVAGGGVTSGQLVVHRYRRAQCLLRLVLLVHALDEDVEAVGEVVVGAGNETEVFAPVIDGQRVVHEVEIEVPLVVD